MKIDDWMRMVSIGFVRLSPPAVSSLPTCDDIMVLNAKNLTPAETFCVPKLPRKWSARGDHARFAAREKQQSTSLKALVTNFPLGKFAVATRRQSREPFRPPLALASSAKGSRLETSLLMCGRTRTRARRGSARRGRSKPSKARAPTDRVRLAEPRSEFRRSHVALAFFVALPWQPRFPRVSHNAPVHPVAHEGQRMV